MIAFRHARWLHVLAVLAWVAQLWAGVPHVAMAAKDAGWCGAPNGEIAAKLARLPPDIRDILTGGTASAQDHVQCLLACAGAGAAPLAHWDAGVASVPFHIDTPVAAATRLPAQLRATSTSARGPPRFT